MGQAASERGVGGPAVTGWLVYHERAGGHTLARHVGQTDVELIARLRSSRIRGASTFHDQTTAEAVVSRAVGDNRARIQSWLRSHSRDDLALQCIGAQEIGRGINRGEAAVLPRTGATMVLRRSRTGGYYVLSAYPE